VTDTNKSCQVLALDILSRIALGMNKPFEKHVKYFSTAVSSVLADQKANIRVSAVKTLEDIATACEGIEPLIPGLSSSLETSNPTLRSSLLSWLAKWLVDHPPQHRLDLSPMLGQVISCLDDRNSDVRKGAQGLLPHLIASLSYEKVAAEVNSLKPASRSAIQPFLHSFKPSIQPASLPDDSKPSQAVTTGPSPMCADTGFQSTAPPTASVINASRMGNLRGRKIVGASTTGRRDIPVEEITQPPTKAAETTTIVQQSPLKSSEVAPCPFIGSNLEIKKARLAKDSGRWIIEGLPVRKELIEALHSQMDGRVSPYLLTLLFSSDHNAIGDFIAGMNTVVDCYNNAFNSSGKMVLGSTKAILLANDDLALKYACMKIHEPQSNLVSKCIDVIEAVVNFLKYCDHQLSDTEATCFIPTLIQKVPSFNTYDTVASDFVSSAW
jgi:cytoskeleton-associated protein 5